jgi:hypothetical protein
MAVVLANGEPFPVVLAKGKLFPVVLANGVPFPEVLPNGEPFRTQNAVFQFHLNTHDEQRQEN